MQCSSLECSTPPFLSPPGLSVMPAVRKETTRIDSKKYLCDLLYHRSPMAVRSHHQKKSWSAARGGGTFLWLTLSSCSDGSIVANFKAYLNHTQNPQSACSEGRRGRPECAVPSPDLVFLAMISVKNPNWIRVHALNKEAVIPYMVLWYGKLINQGVKPVWQKTVQRESRDIFPVPGLTAEQDRDQ